MKKMLVMWVHLSLMVDICHFIFSVLIQILHYENNR
jgi:hypothetical protein